VRPVLAIVRRELGSYFASPTGYVFITLFVFLGAVAEFWQPEFFAANLANLDPLNRFFPYLLVFLVPAITMGLWADERRHGTDELLLTLPASDLAIVAGKYLAAVGIFTVALGFSLSHVVVLSVLGQPDAGLVASTYLGYWLMGTALLALGMVGSLLTDNLTVSFILGAFLSAVPVFLHHARVLVSGPAQRLLERLSFAEQFRPLAAGIVAPGPFVYFASFAVALLVLNVALLGRRHWPSGRDRVRQRVHLLLRTAALLVIVASLTSLASRSRVRLDVTSEGLHSLHPDTLSLIRDLNPERPVFVEAFLSPGVPDAYFEVRASLVGVLREFEAVSDGRILARIRETVKYSAEARDARERFDIRPTPVRASEESASAPREIFLGFALSSGSREVVVPFLDRGLGPEYELMRSLRMVSQARRRKVGILRTGVDVFGGFDFAKRRQASEWSIVAELKKQYDVVAVDAGSDYPADLDVLVAPMPTTLAPSAVSRLQAFAEGGKALLLLVDPLPAFDPQLAPGQGAADPFGPPPDARPRADVRPLLRALGLRWNVDRVAWDTYNPHPQLRRLPPEVVFVGPGSGASDAFNPAEATTSGLQEIVLLYPGGIESAGRADIDVAALLKTGTASGFVPLSRVLVPSLFGPGLATPAKHQPGEDAVVLAARVKGRTGASKLNAIVVADTDLMGEQFFELRRQGAERLQLDNVTFLLNAVDQLAGDESMIALRKRRPRHRRLEAVEARTRVYEERRTTETRDAEAFAQQSLDQAQRRMDAAVEDLRRRTDLDEQTREIMLQNLRRVEERRLVVARATIEDERERRIEASRADMESSIRAIQSTIKLLAVALPPVPAFLLFLAMSLRRLRRETAAVSRERLEVAR
jgi:ABC-2 type transport system permease protein